MNDISNRIAVFSKALDLRAQRQQVLASNIANADTPGYKARDFDFQAAMTQAMGGNPLGAGLAMRMTAPRHLEGSGAGNAQAALQYRREFQSAVDGNTVDMDVERVEITQNAMQYQVVAQLISDRFQGLRTAMSSTQG